MRGRHRKTLEAVFQEPTGAAIAWSDIEALLVASGCRVIEGSGSRVRFVHGENVETFHRPHPAKEAKRYQVRAARAFLQRLGIASPARAGRSPTRSG